MTATNRLSAVKVLHHNEQFVTRKQHQQLGEYIFVFWAADGAMQTFIVVFSCPCRVGGRKNTCTGLSLKHCPGPIFVA